MNNDFEFESISAQLKYYVENSSQSIFLFEGDVLSGDVDLKDFVSHFDLKNTAEEIVNTKEMRSDEITFCNFHRPISPSSLQKYIDCPRSYFFALWRKEETTSR